MYVYINVYVYIHNVRKNIFCIDHSLSKRSTYVLTKDAFSY